MIKAVFFDLYNTAARFHPSREELQAAACRQGGYQVTPEGIARGYSHADQFMAMENAKDPVFKRTAEAQQTFFAQYERLVLEGAGIAVSQEVADQIFHRLHQMPYGLALYEDVLPTLRLLKEHKLILGLISNIKRDPQQLCESLGLSLYLDFAITSQEVGAEKPHPPIFLAALAKAGVEPHEALHVGDQYDSDVLGARAVGIHPILIDRDGFIDEPLDCPCITGLAELADYL